MNLREYQRIALNIIDRDLMLPDPVLLQAITGSGKTVIIARLVNKYFAETDRKFLILAHKKELVVQFYNTFKNMTDVPESDIGVVCSGLNRTEIDKRVTIGTIQSFVNQVDKYNYCNLLVVDEAHKILMDSGSQYDKVINGLMQKNPDMRIFGCTSTPFRLGHGYIYGDKCIETATNLFPKLNHKIKYTELKDAGFLMPLIGKVAINDSLVDDIANVGTSGDFYLGQLGETMSRTIHLETAVEAIHRDCNEFKHICVFACTINHAEKLKNLLGDECTIVHSQLSELEREMNMLMWKTGKKRIITSVNILVEGFDFPPLDCLAMARPTMSSGLYLQAIGRVLRISEGKTKAFLLDLTDNTDRFGVDIDNVIVNIPRAVQEKETKFEKECPECQSVVHPARMQCPECNYEWPIKEVEVSLFLPSMSEVMFGDVVDTYDVDHVDYFRHTKEGKPPSVRVEYHADSLFRSRIASEWICVEHGGYARKKAEEWWNKITRGDDDCPKTVDEFLDITYMLSPVSQIKVKKDGKYLRIVDHVFKNKLVEDDASDETIFAINALNELSKEELSIDLDDIPF